MAMCTLRTVSVSNTKSEREMVFVLLFNQTFIILWNMASLFVHSPYLLPKLLNCSLFFFLLDIHLILLDKPIWHIFYYHINC